MNWILNVLFWLLILVVLFAGSYFLFFELGMWLTDSASKARGALRPVAVVLSLLTTPALIAVLLLVFRRRRI